MHGLYSSLSTLQVQNPECSCCSELLQLSLVEYLYDYFLFYVKKQPKPLCELCIM